MKAIVYRKYGNADVLEMEEVEKPFPQDDEVRLRVRATALNAADKFLLTGSPWVVRLESGMWSPKYPILGSDVAGIVDAVGDKVTRFKVGDEVLGDLSESGRAGLAEYVCAKEEILVRKPSSLSFEEAASLPMASVTAWDALCCKGKLQAGESVLINGASGGVGTFAVQIAKALGAEVTAVCSPSNIELVRSLGAEHAVDYTSQDVTTLGRAYDVILAANGFHSIFHYNRILKSDGRYIVSGGAGKQLFQAMCWGPILSMGRKKTMTSLLSRPSREALQSICDFVVQGVIRPVIAHSYSFRETKEAFASFLKQSARGKIVISQSS